VRGLGFVPREGSAICVVLAFVSQDTIFRCRCAKMRRLVDVEGFGACPCSQSQRESLIEVAGSRDEGRTVPIPLT
jgi:hypothetical protein